MTIDARLNDSETTIERVKIIRRKKFLCLIYHQWYQMLVDKLGSAAGPVLEIGSGAGFFSEFVDNLITSDILPLPYVDHVFDACQTMPLESESLRGIAMVNTLHHLPNARQFFQEASRCLAPGGVITMIEPWSTPWSGLIYANLHHEPFRPDEKSWSFQSSGPLSGSNQALPWIVFERDRAQFESEFPIFEIVEIKVFMPIKYLLSGGFSAPALVPGWSFGMFTAIEDALAPFSKMLGMFAQITVRKRIQTA
ncbi:MAG TPA: methyltransferase domain-containing protein [Chroococcales cyanobacterium]